MPSGARGEGSAALAPLGWASASAVLSAYICLGLVWARLDLILVGFGLIWVIMAWLGLQILPDVCNFLGGPRKV